MTENKPTADVACGWYKNRATGPRYAKLLGAGINPGKQLGALELLSCRLHSYFYSAKLLDSIFIVPGRLAYKCYFAEPLGVIRGVPSRLVV